MAELDQEEDVVFKALVVEAAWVVGASWALSENKIIGKEKISCFIFTTSTGVRVGRVKLGKCSTFNVE